MQGGGTDILEARRLLAEAGYADGLELEVDTPTELPDEAQALTAEVGRQLAQASLPFNSTTQRLPRTWHNMLLC